MFPSYIGYPPGLDVSVDVHRPGAGGGLTHVHLAAQSHLDGSCAVDGQLHGHADNGGNAEGGVEEHEALGEVHLLVVGQLEEDLQHVDVVGRVGEGGRVDVHVTQFVTEHLHVDGATGLVLSLRLELMI